MVTTALFLEFLDMRLVALDVARGLAPLLAAGWIFSLLPWNRRHSPVGPGFFPRLLRGGALVFVGLTLFLQGVNLGFLPVGHALGVTLTGIWEGAALIPFGLFLGLAVCMAEPAVSVLGAQVEEATQGTLPRRLLIGALCVGVSLATALGMARLLYGWPILWIVAPGYALVILLSRFCTPSFTAIAYDSSTVVTGPMVSTFLMAVALGAAGSLAHRDPMLDGFGLVAVVAMVPVIAVMLLGCVHALLQKRRSGGSHADSK